MAGVNPFKRLPFEVFLIVLEESLDGIRTANYTTVTRLAQTCRDFLEPSRDIIWRQIPHIAVLFYLLPQDMWKLDKVIVPGPEKRFYDCCGDPPKKFLTRTIRCTMTFTRPLTKGDLDRVCEQFAPRVRILWTNCEGVERMDSEMVDYTLWVVSEPSIKAILDYLGPNRYLFPRLIEYGFCPNRIPFTTLDHFNGPQTFHRFLGPAVQNIATVNERDRAPAHQPSCQNISNTLMNLNGLTKCSVNSHPLPFDVFKHLGNLPRLEELKAIIPLQTRQNMSFLQTLCEHARRRDPFFSTLRTLSLCYLNYADKLFRDHGDMSPVYNCFPALETVVSTITSRQLESIRLEVDRPKSVNLEKFLKFFSRRVGIWPLRELEIVLRTPALYTTDSLPGRAFEPLLLYRCLRKLNIEGPIDIALSDYMVEKMAHAWPELCELQLECLGSVTHGLPTPRALLHLAKHCPELHMLRLNFDLRGFSESNWKSTWDGKEHSELQWFSPVMSHIDAADVGPFAEFLGSVFIDIWQLIEPGHAGLYNAPDMDAMRARWSEVWKQYEGVHGCTDFRSIFGEGWFYREE